MGYKGGLTLVGNKYHYRFWSHGELLRGSTGCTNLQDARKWLDHYRSKVNFEGIGIFEMPTLGGLLDEWAMTAGATNQQCQIDSMKAAMNRHCKHLLGLRLDQLTTERIQATLLAYVTSQGKGPIRKGHTAGGANALRLRLNTLMGYAIRCGYLTKKPYDVKRMKTQQKPRPVVRAGKTQDFLAALNRLGRSKHKILAISVMLALGLRESEALGLRWEFINMEAATLVVGRIHEGQFMTKGGEARVLHIPNWLMGLFRAQWEKANKPVKGLVLPSSVDKKTRLEVPHCPGYTARLVRRVGEELGFPGLTPHRLRASFITALVLEGNVPLPQAQRMAGHKHIMTTMKYVEGAEDHKEALAALDRLRGFSQTHEIEQLTGSDPGEAPVASADLK